MSTDQLAHDALAVDLIPIQVHKLSFSYAPKESTQQQQLSADGAKKLLVLDQVSVSFDQGKLYAFVGPPREGKATFLKLLGQSLYPVPGCGDIFMPPHLRCLHVSREGTILRKASFLKNVIMGSTLEESGGEERVRKICKRLGFSERMLKLIHEDFEGQVGMPNRPTLESRQDGWAAWFSHTDYARLNLARVLVENPEVCCIHKPSATFDDRERENIISLLREHVDEKGIELPVDSKVSRRPRTVFFTAISTIGVAQADAVYKVSLQHGVHPIPKTAVNEGMII